LIIGQVNENCVLLGCYAASSGNSLPTFRDNLSFPFSWVKSTRSHELLRRARISTGIISESFRQYLDNIPGKHKVKELQKAAILGTANTDILWKVLM